MGTIRRLDQTGDTKLIWDVDNRDEVKAAEDMFNKLTKEGFTAFSVKKNGDKNELITKFNKFLEAIILVPRVVGG